MPHTAKQERYFRYAGIKFLPGQTERGIRKILAKNYGISPSKVQIDKKNGSESTYIVTIMKHKKPVIHIGKRRFIIS